MVSSERSDVLSLTSPVVRVDISTFFGRHSNPEAHPSGAGDIGNEAPPYSVALGEPVPSGLTRSHHESLQSENGKSRGSSHCLRLRD